MDRTEPNEPVSIAIDLRHMSYWQDYSKTRICLDYETHGSALNYPFEISGLERQEDVRVYLQKETGKFFLVKQSGDCFEWLD